MHTKTRRPTVRSGVAALVVSGALVALLATASGAVTQPKTTTYPAYPTKLTTADIKLAATYIGGKAGKAATGPTIKVGFINDETGSPAYPENEQGATVAADFINKDLGGLKGDKLAFIFCDAQSTDAAATACGQAMVNDHVKVVVTGTLIDPNDSTMYDDLFNAGIPVLQGNDLTTTDFSPPGLDSSKPSSGKIAATYMPGSPGVVEGMAKFIGQGGLGASVTTKNITAFYDSGDTGSQTACELLFKPYSSLKSYNVTCAPIAEPWELSQVEAAMSSATAGSIFVPLIPVQVCISFAQGMTALHLTDPVVTTGLCFGKQLKTTLGTYPNGWYFGDYGINYFMYDSKLAASEQLAVYIAAVDKFDKSIDYTGFAGPSFGTVLTLAKFYNELGTKATSAQLATKIWGFKGPQWGISGTMACGKVSPLFFPTICGKEIGIAQFKGGKWIPIADAYNNKLINPF